MNPHRISTALLQEIKRPRSLWFPAIFLSAALVTALLDDGIHGFLFLTYLLLPVSFTPLATHVVSRGRRNKLTPLHATSPLTTPESLLATVTYLTLLLIACLLVTLPVYLTTLSTAPAIAYVEGLQVIGFGGLVGLAATGIGLVVGTAMPRKPRLALGTAFALLPLWIGLMGNHDTLLEYTDGVAGWLVRILMITNPLSWAATADSAGPLLTTGSLPVAVGLVVLILALWTIYAITRSMLQHPLSWHISLREHPRPVIALLAVTLLTGGALGAWFPMYGSEEHTLFEQPTYHQVGQARLEAGLHKQATGPMDRTWDEQMKMRLDLFFIGEPHSTLTLENVHIQGDAINFEPLTPLDPQTYTLDDVRTDIPWKQEIIPGPLGTNHTRITFQAEPQSLTQGFPDVTIHLTLDGHEYAYAIALWVQWPIPAGATVGTTLVTALPLLAATRYMPQRWNTW